MNWDLMHLRPWASGACKHAREHATGPQIGERLPDFSVNDAFGNRVNFHEDRGVSKPLCILSLCRLVTPLLDAAR